MKLFKILLSYLLVFAMAFGLLTGVVPVNAYAQQSQADDDEKSATFEITLEPDFDFEDNDALFAGYVEKLFYGSDVSLFARKAGDSLSGNKKIIYDALAQCIKQIASGERASTIIGIGETFVRGEETIVPDVQAVFDGYILGERFLSEVLGALRADYPYELYWYDITKGVSVDYIAADDRLIYVEFSMCAAGNYQAEGDCYRVDTAKTGVATAAAANAKQIINKYFDKSDYEKLVGYKNEICDLVSYDFDAAEHGDYSYDNDPWQLIHVFDNDPNTNVVCEGYSKAFMYLCQLSSFIGEVECYTVTGDINGGGHMWNIVTLAGKNYLVDVTNSDSGMIGQFGGLFLNGTSGSVSSGYTFLYVHYVYDNITIDMWGTDSDSILLLSAENYDPASQPAENIPAGLQYTISDNQVTITGYSGTDTNLIIPATIGGTPVTSIGRGAFQYCRSLTSVTIPDSVTSIGGYAFHNCDSLTSINMPDSVTSIGDFAFSDCSSLTSVTIGDSVTSIGEFAFSNCSGLISVTIPDGVTSIARQAFSGCSSLTYNSYDNGKYLGNSKNPYLALISCNDTFITSCTIHKDTRVICGNAFYKCSGLTNITIPDSVISVENSAFSGCNIKKLIIADGSETVTSDMVVCESSLTEVIIPDSVTSIGDAAFAGCDRLASITIPVSVISIGDRAFAGCDSLTSITIPDSVNSIGEDAFYNCDSLTSITIPDSVTSIGEDAFYLSDSLTDVYITDIAAWCNICFTNDYANPLYYGDNLYLNGERITELVIPDGLTTIPSYAFKGCTGLKEITISDSVTSVGWGAFSGCSIEKLVIADGSKTVTSAMVVCESTLKEVVIPDSVTSIERYTLSNCGIEKLIIADGSKTVTSTMVACKSTLKEVVIPDSVTSIGDRAFEGCWDLTSVNIGDGVTSIGNYAFRYCYDLTNITIPDSLTDIGAYAFSDCKSLTSITIPDSVTAIYNEAFYNCISLTDVYYCGTQEQRDKLYIGGGNGKLLFATWHFVNEQTKPEVTGVTRVFGGDRYYTAFKAADTLKTVLGVEKFQNVIVASGTGFADALAGSYLASVKDAPILLVRAANVNAVKDYIKKNLASGGTVYLLGGVNAVPKTMETGLDGFKVKRLGGATRYDTNLLILKEAGVADKDIIVCTGKNFADSLSASATGLPILLVKDSLTAAQKDFLKTTSGKKIIVGGTAAVNARIESALKAYGSVKRLAGNTRYDTSVLVAKEFFESPTTAVLAYAQNFPDGLSGGALAYALNAPLILTDSNKPTAAVNYGKSLGIKNGYVLGGAGLISDKVVKNIFSMADADNIIIK